MRTAKEGKPMTQLTMKVLARGNLLVPDYARMKTTGRLCFVGRTVHRAPTEDALPPEARGAPIRARDATEWTGDEASVEALVAVRAPVDVIAPTHPDPQQRDAGSYYRERIREGGLWPADARTAELCGVVFDPSFGGEYPELMAAEPPRKPKGV